MKKLDRAVQNLAEMFFIIEGEITDLLTYETMQNLNANMQNTTGAVAIGSALAGQIGNAALANFAASDEGIDVSDFALEITDHNNAKYYFKGCFPVVVFKKGDRVKVIADKGFKKQSYYEVVAIIDTIQNYIWTNQSVTKGRLCSGLSSLKFMFFVGLVSDFAVFMFIFIDDGMAIFSSERINFFVVLLFWLLMCLGMGWKVGASFDEQSVELEAILVKLGFNKPKMMNLEKYAVDRIKQGKKIFKTELPPRWEQYTYRLDLAQKDDAEKYGKK